MKRVLGPCIVIAFCAGLSAAAAQNVRTEAPCSPVIDRTQGSVTITFTDGCTAGISPEQIQQIINDVQNKPAAPPESVEELARRLGVTDAALATFLRILGERKVSAEDLDAKLREIAARHLMLLKQIEAPPGEDPQVGSLRKEAMAAIDAGNYARAEALLQQLRDVTKR